MGRKRIIAQGLTESDINMPEAFVNQMDEITRKTEEIRQIPHQEADISTTRISAVNMFKQQELRNAGGKARVVGEFGGHGTFSSRTQ